jgi:hypothetical protein
MGEEIGENLEAGEGVHMNATAQGQSGRAQDESGRGGSFENKPMGKVSTHGPEGRFCRSVLVPVGAVSV